MEQPGTMETSERDFSLRVSLGLLAAVILGGLVFVVEPWRGWAEDSRSR
jgi:hypothetical protein